MELIDRQTAQRLFGKALTFKERQGKLLWTTAEVKQFIADFVEDLPAVPASVQCEDAVSRQIVIDTIYNELDKIDYVPQCVYDRLEKALKQLPSVTPKQEYNLNETCTDCKEYDHERHCCPRFNRVIQQTLKELKPESYDMEPPDTDSEMEQAYNDGYEQGVKNAREQPKQRTGKWIYQIGRIKCDQCLRAIRRIDHDGLLNYCPNCGSRMKGSENERN